MTASTPDATGPLFAAHQALAAEIAVRAVWRESTSKEARERQRAADAAVDASWAALIAARRALDAAPRDLALVAALDQADAEHRAARIRSERVYKQVRAVMTMLLEESTRDTTRLTELGRKARAAQDNARLVTRPED
jgi:hypothetical protein